MQTYKEYYYAIINYPKLHKYTIQMRAQLKGVFELCPSLYKCEFTF